MERSGLRRQKARASVLLPGTTREHMNAKASLRERALRASRIRRQRWSRSSEVVDDSHDRAGQSEANKLNAGQ